MSISIGTNWDAGLIESLGEYPEVTDLYGSLPRHVVGHGRPYASVPKVTPEEVAEHLRLIHDAGRTFTYCLNAPSMGGRQFDGPTLKRVLEHVEWVDSISADFVVVSIPALVALVKERFPRLRVKISHNAMVLQPDQARLFEAMGADMLTAHGSAIRDFRALKLLVDSVSIPVQIICTANCVKGCPNRVSYHSAATSMLSSERTTPDPYNRHATGYCFSWCHLKKLERPEATLKSGIRPEDMGAYERIGITSFKLDTRVLTTAQILDRVKAFVDRKWEGDLKRLFSIFSLGYRTRTGTQMGGGTLPMGYDQGAVERYFDLGKHVDYERLPVSNDRLEGIIDAFVADVCRHGCNSCSVCEGFAERAVEWDAGERAKLVAILEDYRKWMFER